MKISVLCDVKPLLGEGPIWDVERQRLWFIDSLGRRIFRCTEQGGENYEEVRYEGFGPAGVGVIVEALTDNRNRTASEVRTIFAKNGGNLGETGSVSFSFERVGSIEYAADAADADAMFEAAIEAGADDCSSDDEGHTLICNAESLHEVAGALEASVGAANSATINCEADQQEPC